MSDKIIIRLANSHDVDVLTEFNIDMALETEGKELPPEVVFSGVKRLLNNPHYGFYIIGEKEGVPAGSLMVTTEWSDWRDGVFWWIQSVYVKPQFRMQGIFRKLYGFIRSKAEHEPNVCGLRLYVERNNIQAQKAYKAHGMAETHYKIFEELLSKR